MINVEPGPWSPAPAPTMDEITFKSDTVLSDVHLYTPNQRHLMVRLNGMGQPVFLSQFKLLWNRDSGVKGGDVRTEETPPTDTGSPPGSGCHREDVSLQAKADTSGQEGLEAQLDEDGDLDVVRRPRAASDPSGPLRDKDACLQPPSDHVCSLPCTRLSVVCPSPFSWWPFLFWFLSRPEHTMATPLEDVGKQVWRGALLLADYVLFQRDLFQGRTVLELGGGTGLASIVAATVARTVYCTDVGADLLAMCQRNVALNSHLTAAGDPEVPFSWSEEDISDLYGHTTILLAAEVFYDDDLTDALFKTLSRLAHKLKNACTAILSVEKRLNFTLRHLDVTCEAYDHFRSCLRQLERLADGRLRFVVEPVDASFPQLLVYERIQQLAGVALHSGGSVRSRAPGGPSLRRATTSGRPPRSQPPRPLLLVRMPGSRWNLARVVPSPASIKGSFTQSRNQLLPRFSSHGARCPGKGRARCHSSGPFDPVAP
ncbi:methyltransferase-like protein 22 isoform X6 [Camelus bactrianus]|uniref:Methyltransferase-like protein 22 isoform X6 n=1 Tax=Camelus bactrianus TaxID=9837 RepID=A0AC58NYK7_CAMBA